MPYQNYHEEEKDNRRFHTHRPRLCIGCGLCLEICPEDAISKDESSLMMVDEDKCIHCGACSNICPARAVLFEREFGLSD